MKLVARLWEEVGMKSCYLMVIEFKFCKKKEFWRLMMVMAAEQHEYTNASELYI